MYKKRLLKLADFLETVPRRAFVIAMWVRCEATKPEGKAPGACGFAGCAIGWAQHAKLFRRLTLKQNWLGECEPVFNGETGFNAVEQLFNIGATEARQLFSASWYDQLNPTPKQVAKRIRKFVEDGHV